MRWWWLCLLAGLTACSEPPEQQKSLRTVVVQSVSVDSSAVIEAVFSGDVRARHEHELGFRIGGKLLERHVELGDQVSAGSVLARLDPEDVRLAMRAADAQVTAAEAQFKLASAELARVEALHRTGFVSVSALDARRTEVDAARAALSAARAQASLSANQSDRAELRSAVDGIVVAVLAEAGQVLAVGQPVLRLVQLDEREVLVHVPESRAEEFPPGREAQVMRLDGALPGKIWVGVVRERAPVADRLTRSFALRVAVQDQSMPLPLGSTASVAFSGLAPQLPALPLSAVTAIEGRPTVWVVDADARLQPLEVEIERYESDRVLIRSGLSAGMRVVVAGVHKLLPGEQVRVVEANAPAVLDIAR